MKKSYNRNLIGFILIIVGGVLTAVTGFLPFVSIVAVGVFFFVSFPQSDVFFDYVIPNTQCIMMRRREYVCFLPLWLVISMITLGYVNTLILVKEEYYIGTQEEINSNTGKTMVTREKYVALRDQMRQVYSTETFDKKFMEEFYSPENIGYERKKRRMKIVGFIAALMLTTLTVPGAVFLFLIYEIPLVWVFVLWHRDYKDAKVLHEAYIRALQQ